MIRDLRDEHVNAISVDLCIIGSGAAGTALAAGLARSSLRIALLESGGLEYESQAQDLCGGEIAGLPFIGLTEGRHRGFGGTTRTWAGQCLPLDAMDLRPRAWVPHSGWPIDYAEIAAYYPAAMEVFSLRDERFDATNWEESGLRRLAFAEQSIVPRFTVYSPQADLGKRYHSMFERSENITLYLHAHALRLATNATDKRVDSIEVTSGGIRRTRFHAARFVLCTGGIENARLLLVSGSQAHGLGNAYGNVGRFFQDHANGIVAQIEQADVRRLQEYFGLLYRGRVRYFPKLSLSPQVQERARVLNAIAHPVFEERMDSPVRALRTLVRAARGRGPLGDISTHVKTLASGLHEAVDVAYRRYALGRSPLGKPTRILLQAHVEQAPSSSSRIMLSAELDRYGVPKARVDWRLGHLERRTFGAMTAAVTTEFERLKLGRVIPRDWVYTEAMEPEVLDAFHHAGTTRLSSSPQEGVVDTALRVHGVDNLYLCGGSVFPTSGYANPTLTIVALALRLAHMLERDVVGLAASSSVVSSP